MQVVPEIGLHQIEALHLVGQILERLAHIQAELVIAHGHEIVDVLQRIARVIEVFIGHEIAQIAGIEHGQTMAARIVQLKRVFLHGDVARLSVIERGGAAFGQFDFALVVAIVGQRDVVVAHMQRAEGLLQPDFNARFRNGHIVSSPDVPLRLPPIIASAAPHCKGQPESL